jgi:threonyl-tRNA synthetase
MPRPAHPDFQGTSPPPSSNNINTQTVATAVARLIAAATAAAQSIIAMKCTKLGAAYWRGSADNDSLQRVYGISFPDKKEMSAWELRMEEVHPRRPQFLRLPGRSAEPAPPQAKKRDHRLLGVKQDLFFFNSLSPGSCARPIHLVEWIRGRG